MKLTYTVTDFDLKRHVKGLERVIIEAAYRKCGYSHSRTARLLGLSRPTLYSKREACGAPKPKELEKQDYENTVAAVSGSTAAENAAE